MGDTESPEKRKRQASVKKTPDQSDVTVKKVKTKRIAHVSSVQKKDTYGKSRLNQQNVIPKTNRKKKTRTFSFILNDGKSLSPRPSSCFSTFSVLCGISMISEFTASSRLPPGIGPAPPCCCGPCPPGGGGCLEANEGLAWDIIPLRGVFVRLGGRPPWCCCCG